jgi:hypothetical protein
MASLKTKGDLAELKVAADLVTRGYRIAIPFGEDCDFDLVLVRGPALERVQVKYTESKGDFIHVRTRSHSLTNGKVRHTKHYTSATVDWIAVYDRSTDRCYYVPAEELGSGRSGFHLRLTNPRNNQRIGIRYASAYLDPEVRQPQMEAGGIEPPTRRCKRRVFPLAPRPQGSSKA